MQLNFKQLEAFVLVADSASFRGAAERLNTTQPNISSRIAALETALGAVLFERDGGTVRLTSRGTELLPHARQVLRSGELFLSAAGRHVDYDGTLKLGVSEMVVHTWLSDFLKAVRSAYPRMLVELNVDLSASLDRQLNSRALDLAFHSGPFEYSTTGSLALGAYPLVWVCSPQLPLTNGRLVEADEMLQYPLLTHARQTRPYQQLLQHFQQQGGSRPRLVPSSNLTACLQMTVDGLGVAALLEPMVEKELVSGRLAKVNYAWLPDPLHFEARFHSESAPTALTAVATLGAGIASQYLQQFNSRQA